MTTAINSMRPAGLLGFATWSVLAASALGLAGCGETTDPSALAAPDGVAVTAASRGAISLGWVASGDPLVTGYRVERSVADAASFSLLGEAAGGATTSFTDATVDAYLAYTYRVRAMGADELASEPSNEDTAGPPPARLQVAAPPPSDQGVVYRYGVHTALGLDEADDPALAYVGEYSVSSSGDTARLYFVRWNRTEYRWGEPLLVDELGTINSNHPNRQVSLARDSSNGRFGIAYTVGSDQVWLALSTDGGATWGKERIDLDDNGYDGETSNPVLALAGDQTHVAYYHACLKAAPDLAQCASQYDSHAVVYLHRSGASGSLTSQLSPVLPGTQDAKPWLDLALDGDGQPGVSYFLGAESGAEPPAWYNVTLAFWRPGQAASRVTDSMDQQDDTPSVSLAFQGTRPLVVYHLVREAPPTAHDLWLSVADDGSTWGEPVPLPRDGRDRTVWYQSVATDSAGNASSAAYFMAGSGDGQFGGPKLVRSPDLAAWTVSSPDAAVLPGFAGEYVDVAYAGNDKLNLAFGFGSTEAALGAGPIFWREH